MNVIHNPELVLGGYDRVRGGSVTHTQDIYNRMGVPIYVILRNGYNYVVHPSVGGAGRFNVDNTIVIDNQFRAGVNCDLNVTNHPYLSEQYSKRLYNDWLKCKPDGTMSYHLTISGDDLKDGSVYIDMFDLVISINPPGEIPLHPRSQKSILDTAVSTLEYTSGFSFQVKIIDNDTPAEELKEHGKYINVNGIVARIQPERDPYLPKGIYIITNDPQHHGQWQYYPEITSACPIVLYDLPETAASYGDIGKRLEEENRIQVQQLKLKETQYKNDLIEATRQFEEESRRAELAHKEELRRIEQLKAASDAEYKAKMQQLDMLSKTTENIMSSNMMRQKAMYEGMSHARKNTTENLKMFPTVLNFISTFFKF